MSKQIDKSYFLIFEKKKRKTFYLTHLGPIYVAFDIARRANLQAIEMKMTNYLQIRYIHIRRTHVRLARPLKKNALPSLNPIK